MADTAKIIEENAAAPSEDDGSLPVAAELDSTSFLPDDDAEEAPSDSLGTALSVPVADASLDNASSDNNSDGPDTNVEGWFSRHALPVTEGVKISLDDWGVYCVEQLKLLPSDIFLGMFDPEKLIVRETAVSPKMLPIRQVLVLLHRHLFISCCCYFTHLIIYVIANMFDRKSHLKN